jgi:hypothetical protein
MIPVGRPEKPVRESGKLPMCARRTVSTASSADDALFTFAVGEHVASHARGSASA